jgi:hypothetical protein
MAGAIKHMERSHYSYSKHNPAFTSFHNKAYSTKIRKENALSLGQRLAKLFKRATGGN